VEGLGTLPYREAHERLRTFGDTPDVDEAELHQLLDQVPALVSQYPDRLSADSVDESGVWHQYESLIWAMGESFRRTLKSKRSLRDSGRLWERVEAVCLDATYGRGRESFTMLLGQYGGQDRVPVLLQLLDDPEVSGHALYALRLIGSPEAVEQARDMLESPRSWVRAEAKKYLAKVQSPDRPVA